MARWRWGFAARWWASWRLPSPSRRPPWWWSGRRPRSGVRWASVSLALHAGRQPLFESTARAALLLPVGQALPSGAVSAKVIALSEGVSRAMLVSKTRIAAEFLAGACVVGTVAGVGAQRALTGPSAAQP